MSNNYIYTAKTTYYVFPRVATRKRISLIINFV